MEQSTSWEANNFAPTKKISCILWKSKVHLLIHQSLPAVQILSQIFFIHLLFHADHF